jgi:hypothetical protein
MIHQVPDQILVGEGQVSFCLPPQKQRRAGRVGDVIDGWMVRWIQDTAHRCKAILEQTTNDGGAFLIWSEEKGGRLVRKPRPGAYRDPQEQPLYMGHTLHEVLSSGRDVLGEALLSQGEPTYEAIAGLLPPLHKQRYQILGTPQSRGKYLMMMDGTICTGERRLTTTLLFAPALVDGRTAQAKTYDGLLDDWMPAACYRLVTADAFYDLIAFVKHDEGYRTNPDLRIRLSRYRAADVSLESEWYYSFTRLSHSATEEVQPNASPSEFYSALAVFVEKMDAFAVELAPFQVPEKRIHRWVLGSLALTATTYEGDRAKYGAVRHYGDVFTFAPALLDTAEAFINWGSARRARRYLDYWLYYVLRDDGTFPFGGSSASEYGRWLWILERAERQFDEPEWLAPYLGKLVATAWYLESLRKPIGGACRLIHLCAEADNRAWPQAYFSNNLWAYLGLRALAQVLLRHGQREKSGAIDELAASLWSDTQAALRASAVETEYGPVVPSYVGYPAPPWTLSQGPALPTAVSDEEGAAYSAATREVPKPISGQVTPKQWLRENTYTNYRYHLEALSSMLLEAPYAQALDRLRKDRGGELLGMTRFMGWLDDWPVANYARYLLTTDQIDRFLLLFYAHMAHHGNRETLTYCEQVTADGGVIAGDCVPCLLTVPLMTAWMLCFEPVNEDSLYLFRGIPTAWLKTGEKVAFDGMLTTAGRVAAEICLEPKDIVVNVSLPDRAAERQVWVDLRLGGAKLDLESLPKEIQELREIKGGYRLRLRPGLTGKVHLALSMTGLASCSALCE